MITSLELEVSPTSAIAYSWADAIVTATVTVAVGGYDGVGDPAVLSSLVYDWGNGDVNSTALTELDHGYSLAGSYTVAVTATDSSGHQLTVSKFVTIYRDFVPPVSTPVPVPPRQDHTPLNPKQPAFQVRRPRRVR